MSAHLRYFASRCPIDIALVHGMSHSQVFNCIWAVVDAINSSPEFDIVFPANYTKQRKIALEFQRKSQANFAH